MPKKIKTDDGVISRDSLIESMRRLSHNSDFQLLRRRWVSIRGQIIEKGKENPSEAMWNKLAGFDAAVLETEFWASKDAEKADIYKQAEALLETLA